MADATSKSGGPTDVAGKSEQPPTPEALIAATIKSLQTTKDIDTELLGILSEKILTMKPTATAVVDAAAAIAALASKRAQG